jgi:pyridoxal/pyridoxine/pyridoxamine kinase
VCVCVSDSKTEEVPASQEEPAFKPVPTLVAKKAKTQPLSDQIVKRLTNIDEKISFLDARFATQEAAVAKIDTLTEKMSSASSGSGDASSSAAVTTKLEALEKLVSGMGDNFGSIIQDQLAMQDKLDAVLKAVSVQETLEKVLKVVTNLAEEQKQLRKELEKANAAADEDDKVEGEGEEEENDDA